MKNKIIPILLFTFIILSTTINAQSETKFRDTIAINYQDNKTLLDILKVLPINVFDSWEWSDDDRIKTVDFIAKNNYLIDSTAAFNNIKHITPNYLNIQVVDGVWLLAIYKFSENDFFVVTDDIVGDGNTVHTFNYKNNKLTPTKMLNWFSRIKYKILLNDTPECRALIDENEAFFDYTLGEKDTIIISSWLFNKEEHGKCFKGNTIRLKANKKLGRFDIDKVYWVE
ncbi:hypothetical protein JBL43_09755 [Aureibaculum sp. A20]|uniref:Uncharacterized protein n=1 Tax=Aureibaculum flavum TaxID=2795986 RepID=A0ABS0WRB0_9FLAO|nr:hypothetical protein [Aureibaculum flavum]MBJ2174522.1 hypothetical protein [Aureibaculum flavum]